MLKLIERGTITGTVHVTTEIRSIYGKGKSFEAEFLVGTGVVDCVAPASKLKAIGVKVEGKMTYELADGTPLEMNFGFAHVSFMGSETVAQVVFGPEDCEPILGVVALESTGIAVDPRSRKSHRMHANPLK